MRALSLNAEDLGKPTMQDMQERAYPKKENKTVAGQFAAAKYKSETYSWAKETKQGRLRGRQVLGPFGCCKRVTTVVKS